MEEGRNWLPPSEEVSPSRTCQEVSESKLVAACASYGDDLLGENFEEIICKVEVQYN